MSNLALDLRPQKLEDLLGNESTKRAIKKFAETDNWPNVFLLYGPPGCGKTTLALIIADLAGAEGDGLHEVNASDDNGVDAARALSEISASRPFSGRRRVIILNEFHSYTTAAQQALKDPMERGDTIWIATTDRPDKIDSAIKSRAAAATFELKTLNRGQVADLVLKSAPSLASGTGVGIGDYLSGHGVDSPREILGVLDQLLAGVPIEEAIHGAEHEPLYSEVSNSVLAGNWTKTASVLKKIPTGDYRAMVSVVSAKLKWALLDEAPGPRADGLSACLTGLANSNFADGVAYSATCGLLYRCCKAVSGGTRT